MSSTESHTQTLEHNDSYYVSSGSRNFGDLGGAKKHEI